MFSENCSSLQRLKPKKVTKSLDPRMIFGSQPLARDQQTKTFKTVIQTSQWILSLTRNPEHGTYMQLGLWWILAT